MSCSAVITGCPVGACHRAGHFGPGPLAGHDKMGASYANSSDLITTGTTPGGAMSAPTST
jgi:hypothetical protein